MVIFEVKYMRTLFISSDAQLPVAALIGDINKIISNRLECNINVSDYTKDIDKIGIIILSFTDEWKKWGHGKERRYISYKNRFADIRLNISYDEYLKSDKLTRFNIIKDTIISAIRIIDQRRNKKKGCSFDGQRMVNDIESLLKDLPQTDWYFR